MGEWRNDGALRELHGRIIRLSAMRIVESFQETIVDVAVTTGGSVGVMRLCIDDRFDRLVWLVHDPAEKNRFRSFFLMRSFFLTIYG